MQRRRDKKKKEGRRKNDGDEQKEKRRFEDEGAPRCAEVAGVVDGGARGLWAGAVSMERTQELPRAQEQRRRF